MSNQHTKESELRLSGVHDWQAEEGATDATLLAMSLDAQTQATLAVAYEARTANLIAALVAGFTAVQMNVNYDKLADDITSRLGLGVPK